MAQANADLAVATGVCIFLAGSVTMALALLTTAAVLAAALLVHRVLLRPLVSGGSIPALLILIGLWTFGHFYVKLGAAETVLLAEALPLAGGRRRRVVRTLGAAFPVAAAIGLAGARFAVSF